MAWHVDEACSRRRARAARAGWVTLPWPAELRRFLAATPDRGHPIAVGRPGSELYCDHDPGYSRPGARPARSNAMRLWQAVTPDPQYEITLAREPAPCGGLRRSRSGPSAVSHQAKSRLHRDCHGRAS